MYMCVNPFFVLVSLTQWAQTANLHPELRRRAVLPTHVWAFFVMQRHQQGAGGEPF